MSGLIRTFGIGTVAPTSRMGNTSPQTHTASQLPPSAGDGFSIVTQLPAHRLSDATPAASYAEIAADKFFAVGSEFEQKGNLRKASELYHAALRNDPRHARASVALASINERTGPAFHDLELLIHRATRAPHNAEVHATLGSTFAALGDFTPALSHLTHAVTLAPDNWGYRTTRGRLHMILREFPKAIKDFTVVLEGKPDNTVVQILRGFAYLQSGDYQKSHNDMDDALTRNPDSFDVSWTLALKLMATPFPLQRQTIDEVG